MGIRSEQWAGPAAARPVPPLGPYAPFSPHGAPGQASLARGRQSCSYGTREEQPIGETALRLPASSTTPPPPFPGLPVNLPPN